MDRFSSFFKKCRSRVFFLPFMNLAVAVPVFKKHIMRLYRLDAAILKRLPMLNWYAGIQVRELMKPLAVPGSTGA